MALPVTFANLTTATMADLDENFAALGALTATPCTLAGTGALVLTPAANTPSLAGYVNYQPFTATAVAANPSSVTLQVGALAALPVYKDTAVGVIPLSGGEIVAKALLTFVYDSSLNSGAGGFHMFTQVQTTTAATVAVANGINGSAAGGSKLASWTVNEAIAESSLTGTAAKGALLSVSFNGGVTGAGGMDTGSTPVLGSLSVYLIYDSLTNNWTTLGYASGSSVPSPVYPGSNLPSGYGYSVLLWTGLTDGSGNIVQFTQKNRNVWTAPALVVNTSTGVTSFTAVSVAAAVPYGTTALWGTMGMYNASAVSAGVSVASDTSGDYAQSWIGATTAISINGFSGSAPYGPIPLTTPQQIAWKTTAPATYTYLINVSGYSF